MIDSKITFRAGELLYGDYEKMSLISEIMFRKFLRQFVLVITWFVGLLRITCPRKI